MDNLKVGKLRVLREMPIMQTRFRAVLTLTQGDCLVPTKLFWIALAGAVGTLARYGLAGLVQNSVKGMFPWGTAAVNLSGCLAFGLLWSAMQSRLTIGPEIRTIVLVGFMGAFTTFSSFVFETGQLARDSEWMLALGNVALQNVVGLAALFVGLVLGRMI
jgi:fluoride exporter